MPHFSFHYYPPSLRNSVDVQLQTAFGDGKWLQAARLADKRAKSSKDPYYEAVKICAESQIDSLSGKRAVFVAVDKLIQSGAIVSLEAIELYEWACLQIHEDISYPSTFGTLRLRWVKANPKSRDGLMKCLVTCVQQWDLVDAQQISAILDKTFSNSGDRRFLFWNIVLTYLLSVSPQCPDGKQKLYGLLSLKQLERAAEITINSDNQDALDRGLRTEEELLLYFRVLSRQGSQEDFIFKIRHPVLGAVKQFREGKNQLLIESLDVLKSWGRWDDIYDLCWEVVSSANVNDGSSRLIVSDWRIWKSLIHSLSKTDQDAAFSNVTEKLTELLSIQSSTAVMYTKTMTRASLELAFHLPCPPEPDEENPFTPRLRQLSLFWDRNHAKPAAFDDAKDYIGRLSSHEARYLLGTVFPKLQTQDTSKCRSFWLRLLETKIRYYLTTCPGSLAMVASTPDGQDLDPPPPISTSKSCGKTLRRIILAATRLYEDITADSEFVETISNLDKDPRVDLALVVALSLLRLSGFDGRSPHANSSPLSLANISYVLQAVVVLSTQSSRSPNNTAIRLVLVKLYLLIGCTSLAHQQWTPMDVKRTILDALGPLFFDRISTLSPGLFRNNRSLMEGLRAHYLPSLLDTSPLRLWDAFTSASYSSIFGLVDYDDQLRRSCAMVMTFVEERRADRALGMRTHEEVDENLLLANITDETKLVSVVDYGSFPNLESSQVLPPLPHRIRLGAEPSNERSHLALLAEKFMDLIGFNPSKDFKPANAKKSMLDEKVYLVESLSRLHNSMTTFLHAPATSSNLTGPEHGYYSIVTFLSAMVQLTLETANSNSAPDAFPTLVDAISTEMESMRSSFFAAPPSALSQADMLISLTNQHAMFHLWESGMVVKRCAAFLVTFEGKLTAVDQKAHFSKTMMADVAKLGRVGGEITDEVHEKAKMLNQSLAGDGWLDRVMEWTLGQEPGGGGSFNDEATQAVFDMAGGSAAVEEWAGKLLESWREGMKGWSLVKME